MVWTLCHETDLQNTQGRNRCGVLLLCFGVGPCLYAVLMSFSDPNSETALSFAGLTNYVTALHDFRFWPAFENIALYLLLWLPLMVFGVLGLALLLHARAGRFSSTMRFLYYLPGAVVGSASVLLWLFMLDPQISPFALVLQLFGFKIVRDTLDPSHLPLVLSIMAFSNGAGGWIVIMFGAFQNISPEIMEAASIDGCNAWQTAFSIKLPLLPAVCDCRDVWRSGERVANTDRGALPLTAPSLHRRQKESCPRFLSARCSRKGGFFSSKTPNVIIAIQSAQRLWAKTGMTSENSQQEKRGSR